MKLDTPITDLHDWIAAIEEFEIENQIFLPLTHITRWDRLPLVMKDMKLKPHTGNNYYKDEEILFFTYGRNVFLPKASEKIHNDPYPPLLFVFDLLEIQHEPVRLLPFDSGGFDKYHINGSLTPQNYEIKNPKPQDVKKLVYALFKSHQNYLDYKFDFGDLGFTVFCPSVVELHNVYIAQSTTITEVSKPCKSFEFHFSKSVPLVPKAVLLPIKYQSDPQAGAQFKAAFPSSYLIYYESDDEPIINLDTMNKILKQYILKNEKS